MFQVSIELLLRVAVSPGLDRQLNCLNENFLLVLGFILFIVRILLKDHGAVQHFYRQSFPTAALCGKIPLSSNSLNIHKQI